MQMIILVSIQEFNPWKCNLMSREWTSSAYKKVGSTAIKSIVAYITPCMQLEVTTMGAMVARSGSTGVTNTRCRRRLPTLPESWKLRLS
eukprot:712830-Karenia_brevis.AAC.1